MEKIDYEKIDPLVLPVIKYLREELGIDTEFSCQGMVKGEKKNPPHSLAGYISARYSDSAFRSFYKIYEVERDRWGKLQRKRRGPEIKIFVRPEKREEVVAVYLPVRQWESADKLKEEWNLIYETLKQHKNDWERINGSEKENG